MTTTLPDWDDRPRVPAAMLNPALTATVAAVSANQYEETCGDPMPWPLTFLVVPLVLHTPTRRALPSTSATNLSAWVARNPVLVTGFAARARQLAPYAREGVRFGLAQGLLELAAGDRLRADIAAKPKVEQFGDVNEIVRGAAMVGRIFAKNSSTFSTFAALRVRP